MATWYEVELLLIEVHESGVGGRRYLTKDHTSIIPESDNPNDKNDNLHMARKVFEEAKKIVVGDK